MKKTSETIVFFGSGPVAANSLELLHQSFTIEAVVTKPRPEHYHGQLPVQSVAEKLGLTLVEAADKKQLSAKIKSSTFKSRVGVLIDFGIIVAQDVIDSFPLGIVNSHFSLLPDWRGPDPITFAILSGQAVTGVSLMLLVEKMDKGPILAQATYDLDPDETAISLTSNLIELSYDLLETILPDYLESKIEPLPQSIAGPAISGISQATYSRKLTKDDGQIDWLKPATQTEREIRAFIEWPKCHTQIWGQEVIITKAKVVDATGNPAGQVQIQDKALIVSCGKQALQILNLKPAGKTEMSAMAFLAGHQQKS
ncbi:MAG TPA: methionyl-tRNA formyltransferase [Candidatus Binatia bacterium]|nr:methionyl-tRNA formyltransferase [Candidatus Binatia bacterium]